MGLTFLVENLGKISVSPMYRHTFGKGDLYRHSYKAIRRSRPRLLANPSATELLAASDRDEFTRCKSLKYLVAGVGFEATTFRL